MTDKAPVMHCECCCRRIRRSHHLVSEDDGSPALVWCSACTLVKLGHRQHNCSATRAGVRVYLVECGDWDD
jgi:hypothetical protein